MTITEGFTTLERARRLREEAAALEAQAHREMKARQPTGLEPGWQPSEKAPDGKLVWTKIEDKHGTRNIQTLVRRGNLWFVPDGSMYVYYWPTHFLPVEGQ